MDTKVCVHCGCRKPTDQFYKRYDRKNALHSWCKECHDISANESRKRNPENSYAMNVRYRIKHPHRAWCAQTLCGHRCRGYVVNITTAELYELAAKTKICPICESVIDWRGRKGCANHNSPVCDRLNNETFMNKDNVWIICRRCSNSKSDRTIAELIQWCKTVIEKFDKVET